MNEKLKKKNYI